MEYVDITPGNNNGETFNYAYSADVKKQLDKITNKYKAVDNKETKLDQLKRLDESVTKPGTIVAMILGIVGALVMGTGMSLCMVVQGTWFVPGIIIGLLGMAIAGIAYPVYMKITKKEKMKKGPMILALAQEIANEQ